MSEKVRIQSSKFERSSKGKAGKIHVLAGTREVWRGKLRVRIEL
jgi:hypothetical protein